MGRRWTVDGIMYRHRAHGARPKVTDLIRLKPCAAGLAPRAGSSKQRASDKGEKPC